MIPALRRKLALLLAGVLCTVILYTLPEALILSERIVRESGQVFGLVPEGGHRREHVGFRPAVARVERVAFRDGRRSRRQAEHDLPE